MSKSETFSIHLRDKIRDNEYRADYELHLTGKDVCTADAKDIGDKLKWVQVLLPIRYEIQGMAYTWRIDRVIVHQVVSYTSFMELFMTQLDKQTGEPL